MPDLDFSEFHDLMHPIGSKECRSMPGGILRHLELKWDYEWMMPQALWGKPLCLLGRHTWTEVWDSNSGFEVLLGEVADVDIDGEPDRYICAYCWREKEG